MPPVKASRETSACGPTRHSRARSQSFCQPGRDNDRVAALKETSRPKCRHTAHHERRRRTQGRRARSSHTNTPPQGRKQQKTDAFLAHALRLQELADRSLVWPAHHATLKIAKATRDAQAIGAGAGGASPKMPTPKVLKASVASVIVPAGCTADQRRPLRSRVGLFPAGHVPEVSRRWLGAAPLQHIELWSAQRSFLLPTFANESCIVAVVRDPLFFPKGPNNAQVAEPKRCKPPSQGVTGSHSERTRQGDEGKREECLVGAHARFLNGALWSLRRSALTVPSRPCSLADEAAASGKEIMAGGVATNRGPRGFQNIDLGLRSLRCARHVYRCRHSAKHAREVPIAHLEIFKGRGGAAPGERAWGRGQHRRLCHRPHGSLGPRRRVHVCVAPKPSPGPDEPARSLKLGRWGSAGRTEERGCVLWRGGAVGPSRGQAKSARMVGRTTARRFCSTAGPTPRWGHGRLIPRRRRPKRRLTRRAPHETGRTSP